MADAAADIELNSHLELRSWKGYFQKLIVDLAPRKNVSGKNYNISTPELNESYVP